METKKTESGPAAENARLRGDLLTVGSRVCHDLRTPLGGIMTSAEMLREILAEKQIPDTMTRPILDSVEDLMRLIKQISVVTKATANPLPKMPAQMGEIVSTAVQRLESRAARKNATVVKPETWPEVNGVAAWLDFIWSSFLTNALQHTGEKPRIELGWHEEGDGYRFEISDNGGGVTEAMRPVLFQAFDTLHNPNGARGLGLSIVRRLVELQGGSCGYEPIEGGSRFFFRLPK